MAVQLCLFCRRSLSFSTVYVRLYGSTAPRLRKISEHVIVRKEPTHSTGPNTRLLWALPVITEFKLVLKYHWVARADDTLCIQHLSSWAEACQSRRATVGGAQIVPVLGVKVGGLRPTRLNSFRRLCLSCYIVVVNFHNLIGFLATFTFQYLYRILCLFRGWIFNMLLNIHNFVVHESEKALTLEECKPLERYTLYFWFVFPYYQLFPQYQIQCNAGEQNNFFHLLGIVKWLNESIIQFFLVANEFVHSRY